MAATTMAGAFGESAREGAEADEETRRAIEAMGHETCVGKSPAELEGVPEHLRAAAEERRVAREQRVQKRDLLETHVLAWFGL